MPRTTTPSRSKRNADQRERATRRVDVPGFPELIQHPQCRVCGLVTVAPELLARLHGLWKNQSYGCRRLAAEAKVGALAGGFEPLSPRSIARHFETHVSYDTVASALVPAVAAAAAAASTALVPVTPVASVPAQPQPAKPAKLAKPPLEEGVAVETEDYFGMQELIDKLRARMTEVDQNGTFVDGEGRVDNYGILIWLRLIGETRQALEALNRMRRNDALIKAIIQAHTKRATQLASEPLIARFGVILTHLRASVPRETLAELEVFATQDVKDIFLHAAQESVRESCDTYRLH